jgi:hypothetical protein
MLITSWVARPLTVETRDLIARGELWHYTKPQFASQIIVGPLPPGSAFGNRLVNLSPPTGWTLDLWKVIRDATVWDPQNFSGTAYMKYLYFFLGQPSDSTRQMSDSTRQMNVQGAPISIRIRGSDLLTAGADRIFYRELDATVVLRGDYRGPALVDPLPIA